MSMKYRVGQVLEWVSHYHYEPNQKVMVVRLQKHGKALLSNGWVVDEEGVAEGTPRMRGGSVREMT